MTTGHLSHGAFKAVLAGVTDLKRQLDRLGMDASEDARLLLPSRVGEMIEDDLLRTDPQDWEPFCSGIHVFAEGQLKQLALYDSIWVGWKTGPIRKKKAKALSHPKVAQ